MADYIEKSGLKVDRLLVDFVEKEAIPGTGVAPDQFWSGLAGLVAEFMPRNRAALALRDKLQTQIDEWHKANGPVATDPAKYQSFLKEIGYLVDEPADFTIETEGLDRDLRPPGGGVRAPPRSMPLMSVPGRHRLPLPEPAPFRGRHREGWIPSSPASPARSWWCRSPTPAMRSTPPTRAGVASTTRSTAPTRSPGRRRLPLQGLQPGRAPRRVIARARAFLDERVPLAAGSHADVAAYRVDDGKPLARRH